MRIHINPNGKVGIGTCAPGAKLHVAGDLISEELQVMGKIKAGQTEADVMKSNALDVNGIIKTKEILVTNTGWADFVFHKDYKLPTLQSVKQHIETHSTLPGIPSEKEVQQNGVNLTEMNILLLQKVEELTLYVIQLKEEMNDLKIHQKPEKP